jgi:hypothetical protein
VMTTHQLRVAREAGDLPDVYVASAEQEVVFDDANLDRLLDVSNDLSDDRKRAVEIEEGLRETARVSGR